MRPARAGSPRCGMRRLPSADRRMRHAPGVDLPGNGAGGGHGDQEGLGAMKVAIPRELKNHEYRVAITPAGVHELVRSGHEVFVEQDAGTGSSIPDEDFTAAGAAILPGADEVWEAGDLILKVKEPVAQEYHRMRKDQVLFTYLH